MSKARTVQHDICASTGKRSFADEHDASKALGRARTKRTRGAGGPRRGMEIESRFYWCNACDGYHLTHLSRRSFNSHGLVAA